MDIEQSIQQNYRDLVADPDSGWDWARVVQHAEQNGDPGLAAWARQQAAPVKERAVKPPKETR